ncbi:hypothetical protein ACXJJ3_32790 [Kribbella sp. WER1]
MTPVFPDPRPEMLATLRAKLAGGTYANALIKARYTADRNPAANPPPLVVLSDDGTTTPQRNALERVTIRLTVWHGDPFTARALSAVCKAYLLDHYGPAVRSVAPISGPFPADDPDTGEPMSTVLVSAYTRPL